MIASSPIHIEHILRRLRQVQEALGQEPVRDGAGARLADEVDSMGLVELVALLADDCGVPPDAIEKTVAHRFGTVGELAEALASAGLTLQTRDVEEGRSVAGEAGEKTAVSCWLSGATVRLPRTVEEAGRLDERLGRPPGWLERHAGIRRRHVWDTEDPLTAAAEAGAACLSTAGLLAEEVGALLVTSEAPPLLAGLAAALHHRLGLRPQTPALEVGGACCGSLAAVWLARALAVSVETVLVLAVEAPSRHLLVEPGEAGENAALFGDGAAACVVSRGQQGQVSLPLLAIGLGADGGAGNLLRVEGSGRTGVRVHMDGGRLASRAVDAMASAVREVVQEHGLTLDRLAGVIVHGGNGRMPALVARRLGLPRERVWSRTPETGNLGAASLLAAWEAYQPRLAGPVAWAAVGAGLTTASALTGPPGQDTLCPGADLPL